MRKAIIVVMLLCMCNVCCAYQYLNEIEIAGKIVDQSGNLIADEVTLTIELESVTYPDIVKSKFYDEITSETKTLEKKILGGTFSWELPDATNCTIKASKESYHGDVIEPQDEDDKIIAKDLIFHLVKKGTPAKLEYTNGAQIPGIDNKQSSGKQCGWSFAKRWYFPVDEDIPVDIVLGTNDNNKRTYTMKEPGGFVYCPGLPQRESSPDELYNDFNWMPEAPEEGYVQTICPAEKTDKEQGDIYYYFKTPDGKYAKIAFRGYIDYYLNPDGSRDLEAGEVVRKGPRNPIEAEWLDKELGEDN